MRVSVCVGIVNTHFLGGSQQQSLLALLPSSSFDRNKSLKLSFILPRGLKWSLGLFYLLLSVALVSKRRQSPGRDAVLGPQR